MASSATAPNAATSTAAASSRTVRVVMVAFLSRGSAAWPSRAPGQADVRLLEGDLVDGDGGGAAVPEAHGELGWAVAVDAVGDHGDLDVLIRRGDHRVGAAVEGVVAEDF